MKPLFFSVGLVWVLASFVYQAAVAADLQAGIARVDVTPPLGYRMSGYFHERLATGVRDPLWVKALVLRQAEVEVALVFCDVVGVPQELSEQARRECQTKHDLPAENILIAATHSHTGPLYFGALRQQFHDEVVAREGADSRESIDFASKLTQTIVSAVGQAKQAAEPVVLEAGTAQQEGLSFNRRFFMKDAPVRFNPGVMNPKIIKACGPIDPEVGILLLRHPVDRHPLGSLTVFALHLDTVGGTLYSADYPFFLERSLKHDLGDRFTSLFGNGTCGDINHIDVTRRERLSAEKIGERLADTVKKALPNLERIEPSLAVRTKTVPVSLQQYSEKEKAQARETMKRVGSREVPFLERVNAYKIVALESLEGDTLPMTVQVFRLAEDVAIVALPGEVFVDLGLAIKKGSPFEKTLIVELSHDAPGYVPTEKAFREGSYETVNSRIQPGGGEILVETALQLLEELRLVR